LTGEHLALVLHSSKLNSNLSGNFRALLDRNDWDFHDKIVQQCEEPQYISPALN
jgi:succinate dehydrogenase flavin-adding protein (antitoxin of CptAB toxin-antitoxin module)